MATELKRMQQRRDVTADWEADNPVLLLAELGYDTTNSLFKIGDGVSQWSDLPYIDFSDAASLIAEAINTTALVPSKVASGSGIDPTGVADSTTGLQALINALPVGGMLYIPDGTYKLTAALTINKACSILGESSAGNWTGLSAGGSFDVPIVSPYLRGVVLNQTAAATDGIKITSAGNTVHLENLGILFTGASIRWQNTGHGVNATPTATITNGFGTAPDHGVIGATWRNINVFGHDGDHYAFEMVNTLLCTLYDIRGYGGGLLEVIGDSVSGNYGNLTVIHPYSNLFCEGTAHGYHLVAGAASGGFGLLNLITMIRPQCNGEDLTAIFPTTTAPTTDQYLFLAGEDHAIDRLSIIGPDLESPLSMPVDLGAGGGHHIDVAGTPELSGVPTITALPALTASAGATVEISYSATDNAGRIKIVTGSSLVNPYQALATITFDKRNVAPKENFVLLTPLNPNAAFVVGYIFSDPPNATEFKIASTVQLSASQQYVWYYFVTTGSVLNT